MTTQAKLTETQTTILKTAAGRADGNIEPLPANLLGGFEPWNWLPTSNRTCVIEPDHVLTTATRRAIICVSVVYARIGETNA